MTTATPHLRRAIWSPTIENMLGVVDGQKGSPEKVVLHGLIPADQAQANGVSSFDSLRSLLDSLDDERIDGLALTPRIASGGWVRFVSPDIIAAFSLQAFVVADGTLDDVRLAENDQDRPTVLYFRCEHHPDNLGKPFREPTAHLHVRHKGEPRFPIGSGRDENPVLSFLEFLALNYDYENWHEWAQMVCEDNDLEEAFLEISTLFQANDCVGLCSEQRKTTIGRVKDALWQAKRRRFPWHLEHDVGATLSYWRRS